MESFILQVAAGLSNGAIYALLALSLVMIFQATHHVNFAQGEMATFSTFLAWAMIQAGWSYWWAFLATVGLSFAGGFVLQATVLRHFDKAPALTNVIVFIALLLIFNAMSGWLFGHEINTFPSPFPTVEWAGASLISAHNAGMLLVMAIVIFALFAFLRWTPLGLGLRAAALNPTSARLVGVRVSLMLALGWGLAAAIGSVAGMMVAPILYLDPHMMSGVLLYAFASALLGGIDNPSGAAVGGLIVGVVENLLGAYVIGTDLKLTVALVLIVSVLILCPQGLWGKKVVTSCSFVRAGASVVTACLMSALAISSGLSSGL